MKKLNVAVIGLGGFGERHVQTYAAYERTNLIALCDTNEDRAKKITGKYGVPKYYLNYQEMLAAAEIEAVSIATPDHLHREIAVEAAKAGKHLLIEKPLATSITDAKAILKAVGQAGVKGMVDFHNRINPPFLATKAAVDSGEIGRPRYLYARLSNTLDVPLKMLKWAKNSSALWFLGSHTIDLARWLLQDEVKKVNAVSSSGLLTSLGVDCPDFFVATLEFKGGAIGVFENSWILPTTQPTVKDFTFELLGDQGAIYVDAANNRTIQKFTRDKGSFPDLFAVIANQRGEIGFVHESIRYFVDSVLDDRPPLADLNDGWKNTAVLCAILESCRTHLPVELGE
jgi:predicted dehydrogenase